MAIRGFGGGQVERGPGGKFVSPFGDNKTVRTIAGRSRASVEKSARNAGVTNISHKDRLTLAREIDRVRKDKNSAIAQAHRDAGTYVKRQESKRVGVYRPRGKPSEFWKRYKELMNK